VKVRYHLRHAPVRMRVVGVMKPKGGSFTSWRSLDNTVCVPLKTHQQRFSGIRYVEHLIVFYKKNADVPKVIDRVRKVLRRRHHGADDFIYPSPWSPKRYAKPLEHIQRVIKIALGGTPVFLCLSVVSAS